MKNVCKQSTFFGSKYNIHIGAVTLSDNFLNLIAPNTILFIDYMERNSCINIHNELNKLLELVDSFKKGNYDLQKQNSYQEYFNNLEKNQQAETLFKTLGFENSLSLLKQVKLIKQDYKNTIEKYIENAKKYTIEDMEKIIVKISENLITKVGIPVLLYYLADIRMVSGAKKIASLLLANHPSVRIVLLIISCSMFVRDVYVNLKDSDKKIDFKNNLSIYFGHILYMMDMLYDSYKSSYFINVINEQYGAFRIENMSETNISITPKIIISAFNTPTIFHSFEHLIEFSLSTKDIISTKNICRTERSFAQLSIFTGLNGAIYDLSRIQKNPLEYLSMKFYDFVESHQNKQYNYILYSKVKPKDIVLDNKIETSSSFEHIKNLFLKSHNFVLVKTKSFSSVVIYDLLSQSLKTSQQNNKPISKDILIITTSLNTESFEYQTQKHIQKLCDSNTNVKHCVTFMTPICRISKDEYFISLHDNMLQHASNMDRLIGDNCKDSILAFANQRQEKIKNVFSKVLISSNGYLRFKKIDCNELIKFYFELQDVVKGMEYNPFTWQLDTSIIKQISTKNHSGKEVEKTFSDFKNNFQLLMSSLNKLSVLISYFVDINLENINDFKKDLGNRKNDIEQALSKNKNKLPNNLIRFSQIAINEYLLLQNNINKHKNLEEQVIKIYESKINEALTYKELFSSIDGINTRIVINMVEKIFPIPDYMFIKILTEKTYVKFCFIVFIDCIFHNKPDLLIAAVLLSFTMKSMESSAKQSNIKDIFIKTFLDNTLKSIGDKAVESFFNKQGLGSGAIYLMFGISKPEEMLQSTIKHVFTSLNNVSSYKISIDDFKSFGMNFIIDFTMRLVFNIFFPNLGRDGLREEMVMLLLLQRRYKPMPYAKWEKDSPSMYIPDVISQTFVSADFTAMLIGGSPFNSGCCIHNPSLAGFVQDEKLTHEHTLKILRKYVCNNYHALPLATFHTQSDSIFKEAYCKVLHYIGLAKDEHTEFLTKRIPNATKEKIKKLFNPQTLMDKENLIKTKIKISNDSSNEDESFKSSVAMKYSRDFIIQLKRVAEYNYLVYSGVFDDGPSYKDSNKQEVELLGSLIYDKDFIHTTIDIKD